MSNMSLIIEMCNEFNFYPNEIKAYFIAINSQMILITDEKNKPVKMDSIIIESNDGNILGFYINENHSDGLVLLKFIFIKPKYRRRGLSTHIISKLKETSNRISIDTDKPSMIHLLHKLDFKFHKKCLNGKEICFYWNK